MLLSFQQHGWCDMKLCSVERVNDKMADIVQFGCRTGILV